MEKTIPPWPHTTKHVHGERTILLPWPFGSRANFWATDCGGRQTRRPAVHASFDWVTRRKWKGCRLAGWLNHFVADEHLVMGCLLPLKKDVSRIAPFLFSPVSQKRWIQLLNFQRTFLSLSKQYPVALPWPTPLCVTLKTDRRVLVVA